MLRQWAPRINLVGANTIDDLWNRHFLDSAQLHALIPPTVGSLIDLGSGAGFPGLVLAILGVPNVELVESDARKCAFLREAARVAAVPVTIRTARIETVPPHAVDVVTARACASLDQLLQWSQLFIGPHTLCLFPKGEHAAHEVTTAERDWSMQVTQHPSRSDPRGVILCLQHVRRRD